MDVIEQARHRSSDAFRQSRFLDEAKKNLLGRGEPARGVVLDTEVERVKRKFVEARLAETGMERAKFWGFPNTYTYTKAIGEQIIACSGLAFTIVRPAIVESTVKFPFPGWNEGINTSAPLIYALREGQTQIPGSDNYLDMIPCDMVAGGMTLALGELLDGSAKAVYQLGSSDANPCTMRRFFELSGLYKRKYYQRTGRGGPVLSALQSRFEGSPPQRRSVHSLRSPRDRERRPGRGQAPGPNRKRTRRAPLGPRGEATLGVRGSAGEGRLGPRRIHSVHRRVRLRLPLRQHPSSPRATEPSRTSHRPFFAGEHRLATVVLGSPRSGPGKVGFSRDRGADQAPASSPRASHDAARTARRNGGALRPCRRASANGSRRAHPHELPTVARLLPGVRRATRSAGCRARRPRDRWQARITPPGPSPSSAS